MSFTLQQIDIGPMQNFLYLIVDDKTKKALVVDPAWAPDKINSLIQNNGYTLAGMAITHAHYDHTNAIVDMLSNYDVPVYAHTKEIEYSKSGNRIVGDLGSTVKAMSNEEIIQLGETEIKFLHTPGHTPGSQCLKVGNNLITGDTLFIGACGRSDLPGGDPTTLFQSLRKIAQLPSDLQICPGHDYGSQPQRLLKDELLSNPYLKIGETEFLNAVS